ncbi:MAG: ABC transporter permease [Pleurocapsa minor GSE-CHR-MK-17-07R]|nr:ABC transporter permease [Pleurocapsa minor GSE-CHR-MK 17-07R]
MSAVSLSAEGDAHDLVTGQSGRIVKAGALASAVMMIIAALLATASAGQTGLLANVLLFNRPPTNESLPLVGMLSLFNLAAFLIVLVGVRAREAWTLPLLPLLAAANLALLVFTGYAFGAILAAIAAAASVSAWRSLRSYRMNPMALKELRGRMRGARAFIVLSVYLGLMSAFALLIYFAFNVGNRIGSSVGGEIGRTLFIALVGIEMLLILFIAPALTGGAITGERERQTYDLLRTTLLSPPAFVLGKLESALAYLFLLLLAAIPLQSIAFLFGGVSEGEILLAFVILGVTAVFLGALGIFFSAVMQRSTTANVRAYLLMGIVMFVVPGIGALLLDALINGLFASAAPVSSPLLETILVFVRFALNALNPVTTALTSQQVLIERQTIGFYPYTLSSTGGNIPLISPWALFAGIYLVASAVLILTAVRRARRDDESSAV